jgi:hypothetical protein
MPQVNPDKVLPSRSIAASLAQDDGDPMELDSLLKMSHKTFDS